MNKIRILGTKPYGQWFPIVSWLIRFAEWSKQSHVVIHDMQENTVTHARFNDILEENFEDYMKRNVITESYELELSDFEYISLKAFSKTFIGPQEGYWQSLIGVIIPQIVRSITGDKIQLDNFWPKGFTCSWFVFVAMVMSGGTVGDLFVKYKPIDDEAVLSTDDILGIAKKIVDLQKKQ
jgi:hypothetical protein